MSEREFYHQATGAIADYLWQELRLYPQRNYQLLKPVNGPRFITLRLNINPTYARKIMAMPNELSMAAGLDKKFIIRIDRGQGGCLTLELPKPPPWKDLPVTALPRHRGIVATLGLDTENRPALVDFAKPTTAHILIAGATGSGKTEAGRLLAYDLANQNGPHELRLILIDTKKHGIGWREFSRLPHLAHEIITDEATALRALAWGVAELGKRAKEHRNTPRVFIGIDEAQTLLVSEAFVKPIADLTAVGREFGIHCGLLVQDPTADNLGDASIKRNMTVRLVGRVDSADAAKVATGQSGSRAERLTGAGDMILVQPGDTRRLVTARLDERDLARLPRAEAVAMLDLDQFEDIDRVVEVAALKPGKSGRNPDPLEPEHVYSVLVEPTISGKELNRRFQIGRPKQEAVIAFAKAVLAFMERDGYQICEPETETIRNKIPFLSA